MMLWLFLTGFAAGVISGMGIGGGTLLIPALTIFFGLPQKTAQNINLIYFIPTAIAALVTHIKNKRIEKDSIKAVIPAGILFAAAGSFAALSLDNSALRVMFGWFLLVMGAREIWIGIKSGKNK